MTESDKSIDEWVETLAGRRSAVVGDEASAEAVALRDAMRHNVATVTARAEDFKALNDDHAWQQLSFRLKKEGLLQRTAVRSRTWIPLSAAAAVALGVAISIMQRPTSEGGVDFAVRRIEAPVYRDSGLVALESRGPRPVDRAKKVAVALQALGAAPVIYAQAEVATLDADVPSDQIEPVRQALTAGGIDPARVNAGLVRIVFRP